MDEIVTTNSSTAEPELTQADHDDVNSLLDSVINGQTQEGTEGAEGTQTDATPKGENKDIVQAPNKETPAPADKKPPTTEKKPVAAPAAKVATVAPKGTPAPAATPGAPAEKADAEVDAIQAPKNISPVKLAEGWNPLRTLAKARGERIEQLTTELQNVKAVKPDAKLEEANKALNAELSRYKALYVTESDPEFVEKFDKKIQTNEDAIMVILKGLGMTDDNVAKVKAGGGSANIPDSYWDKAVFPALPFTERKKLERLLESNIGMRDERRKTLDGVGQNFATFEQERKAKQTQEFKVYTRQMQDHQDVLTKDIPWARPQEIPANATPQQKAQIEKDNATYKRLEAVYQAALYPANAITRVETALSACLSIKLADDLAEETGRADKAEAFATQLQAELDAIKNASITNNRGDNAPATKKGAPADTSGMSDLEAISKGLDAAAGD